MFLFLIVHIFLFNAIYASNFVTSTIIDKINEYSEIIGDLEAIDPSKIDKYIDKVLQIKVDYKKSKLKLFKLLIDDKSCDPKYKEAIYKEIEKPFLVKNEKYQLTQLFEDHKISTKKSLDLKSWFLFTNNEEINKLVLEDKILPFPTGRWLLKYWALTIFIEYLALEYEIAMIEGFNNDEALVTWISETENLTLLELNQRYDALKVILTKIRYTFWAITSQMVNKFIPYGTINDVILLLLPHVKFYFSKSNAIKDEERLKLKIIMMYLSYGVMNRYVTCKNLDIYNMNQIEKHAMEVVVKLLQDLNDEEKIIDVNDFFTLEIKDRFDFYVDIFKDLQNIDPGQIDDHIEDVIYLKNEMHVVKKNHYEELLSGIKYIGENERQHLLNILKRDLIFDSDNFFLTKCSGRVENESTLIDVFTTKKLFSLKDWFLLTDKKKINQLINKNKINNFPTGRWLLKYWAFSTLMEYLILEMQVFLGKQTYLIDEQKIKKFIEKLNKTPDEKLFDKLNHVQKKHNLCQLRNWHLLTSFALELFSLKNDNLCEIIPYVKILFSKDKILVELRTKILSLYIEYLIQKKILGVIKAPNFLRVIENNKQCEIMDYFQDYSLPEIIKEKNEKQRLESIKKLEEIFAKQTLLEKKNSNHKKNIEKPKKQPRKKESITINIVKDLTPKEPESDVKVKKKKKRNKKIKTPSKLRVFDAINKEVKIKENIKYESKEVKDIKRELRGKKQAIDDLFYSTQYSLIFDQNRNYTKQVEKYSKDLIALLNEAIVLFEEENPLPNGKKVLDSMAFLIMGSFGIGLATPISDVEIMVLVDEMKDITTYQWLSSFMEFLESIGIKLDSENLHPAMFFKENILKGNFLTTVTPKVMGDYFKLIYEEPEKFFENLKLLLKVEDEKLNYYLEKSIIKPEEKSDEMGNVYLSNPTKQMIENIIHSINGYRFIYGNKDLKENFITLRDEMKEKYWPKIEGKIKRNYKKFYYKNNYEILNDELNGDFEPMAKNLKNRFYRPLQQVISYSLFRGKGFKKALNFSSFLRINIAHLHSSKEEKFNFAMFGFSDKNFDEDLKNSFHIINQSLGIEK